MTEQRKIDRYEQYINFRGFYRSQNGEFVKFDDHERIVSEMQHEMQRLTTENTDLKLKLEGESTEGLLQANREIAIASVDRLTEIRRLKEKVNRLITDRLFPGAIHDNDTIREVMEWRKKIG